MTTRGREKEEKIKRHLTKRILVSHITAASRWCRANDSPATGTDKSAQRTTKSAACVRRRADRATRRLEPLFVPVAGEPKWSRSWSAPGLPIGEPIFYLFLTCGGGCAPFLEALQYQVDAWSGRSKPLVHLPAPKSNLIHGPRVGDVSDIKLIRTDTTLDLSQKAEKR